MTHRNIRIRNFRIAAVVTTLLYLGFVAPVLISAASTPLVILGFTLAVACVYVVVRSFKIKE